MLSTIGDISRKISLGATTNVKKTGFGHVILPRVHGQYQQGKIPSHLSFHMPFVLLYGFILFKDGRNLLLPYSKFFL